MRPHAESVRSKPQCKGAIHLGFFILSAYAFVFFFYSSLAVEATSTRLEYTPGVNHRWSFAIFHGYSRVFCEEDGFDFNL